MQVFLAVRTKSDTAPASELPFIEIDGRLVPVTLSSLARLRKDRGRRASGARR